MTFNFEDKNFSDIISSLYNIDEVDAVALGGSRATNANDQKSDYDIYVYCTKELTNEQKSAALLKHCREAEIGNHYWELEDNCVMNNGICIDIIYRSLGMFEQYIEMITKEGKAFNGYTTCFWHNIVTSMVLFDKSGAFTRFKQNYTIDYPDKLRKNIIENNRKLLGGVLPSYDKQILKAQQRGDLVSVHHRITEFLASYFDIIFALNKVMHPGEKRLVALCKEKCAILPEDFEENINALLTSVTRGDSHRIVEDIIDKLDKVLE